MNGDLEAIQKTLKQVAALVTEMVDPVQASLVEIQRARKRYVLIMLITGALIVGNIVALGYSIRQGNTLLAENKALVKELVVNRTELAVTSEQVKMLVEIIQSTTKSPVVKEKLEGVQKMREAPSPEILEKALEKTEPLLKGSK